MEVSFYVLPITCKIYNTIREKADDTLKWGRARGPERKRERKREKEITTGTKLVNDSIAEWSPHRHTRRTIYLSLSLK